MGDQSFGYGAFILVKLNYAAVNQMITFEESVPDPGTYSFQKLTINTNDEQARFLVFSMTFELYEQSDEQLVLDKEPIIKDALNRLIARRSAKELRSIDMQSQLKQEIGIMVNEILQKNAVTSIYFSEFLVQ